MILTCEFLTSRYVAKATHVKPEWPPHPARLFYALVSAFYAFQSEGNEGGDVEERKALEWLEGLGHPDIFAAPRDQIGERQVVTHHVPANDPDPVTDKQAKAGGRKADHLPEHRGKSERQFPTLLLLDRASSVYYCWPGIKPNDTQQASLQRLFDRVCYLGHSSSLVALGLRMDDSVTDFSATRWQPATNARGDTSLRGFCKGLLELLEQVYEPNELSQQNYRLQHESVLYTHSHTSDETATSVPHSHFGEQWIVYRFPEWVRIPMSAVVSLTTNFKTEACRLAEDARLDADLRAMLSGHQPGSGRPYEGPHVAFICLPYVGHSNASGAVFGLAAVLPRAADEYRGLATDLDSIRRVLHRIEGVPFRGQPVPLERLKPSDLSRPGLPDTLRPARWCRSARVWASVTPVALDRYPGFLFGRARKTEGDVVRTERAIAEARASLRQSCANIGLPVPTGVDLARFSWVEPSPPASAFVAPKRAHEKPPGVLAHVRLEFDEEVRGPVLLGRQRYLGMGLFHGMPSR